MRAGVIGGTRFIGFHLVNALLERGHKVALLHRGRSPEPTPFSKVRRVLSDRSDEQGLDELLREPLDAVFDTCAYSQEDITALLGKRRGRFGVYIFVSTSSVYSVPPPVPYDEGAPRVRPGSEYGPAKRAAEDVVLASSSTRQPAIVLRPQAVTGPWGSDQALYALRRAAAGAAIPIVRGTESRRLCPLWVGDLAEAMIRSVERAAAWGRAIDVAGPDAVNPGEYASAAGAACGRPSRTTTADRAGLPWLAHDLVASGALSRELLGMTPTPLSETLARTWRWAKTEAPTWRRLRWAAADGLLALAARTGYA